MVVQAFSRIARLRNRTWAGRPVSERQEMPLLYERHETPDRIEVTCRWLPVFYLALLVAVVLSLASRGQWTNICMSAVGILLIAWVIALWKPMREIHRAMRDDSVVVSGSKFSFTNPIKMVIKK